MADRDDLTALLFGDTVAKAPAPLDRGPGQASRPPTTPAPSAPRQGAQAISPTFHRHVDVIARRLGASPQDLLDIMHFETGGTFDPAQRNLAGSGATGLIQFLPATARGLGTSTEQLARMTPEEQLAYVERYLQPYRGSVRTLQDAYMAVLNPSAIGKPASHVLFREGTTAYTQNRALD